tara:strand:+ start:2172 stop:2792 length:621 start_codon:yes stop_codon:yes gene_type:complete
MINFLTIASAVGVLGLTNVAAAPLSDILDEMETENTKEELVQEIQEQEIVADKGPRWVCENCNENERVILAFFQDYGITDKYALATLMGNIQQESRFTPNICEGGARVPYHRCHSGGYGLIQWTTSGRYRGLGRHARQIGGDPSSLKTQLSYLVTEREWKAAEPRFKTPGKPIGYYMNGAYTWLGWGIHGNRTHYSNQYVNRLTQG